MSDRRIEPEDLGGLEGLPPDDARMRSLESQPRVRAQQRAFREFLAPGDAPDPAQVAEAEVRMREALEREIGIPLGGASGGRAADAAARARHRGSLWAAWPRLRPALAFAAVVLVAGGAWMFATLRRESAAPQLRASQPVIPRSGLVTAEKPERLDGGGLRLTWAPVGEADSYTVVFLAPDLAEVAQVAGLRQTHLNLKPGSLPRGLVPGSRVLWRVSAMRGADEVARSGTLTAELPPAAPGGH